MGTESLTQIEYLSDGLVTHVESYVGPVGEEKVVSIECRFTSIFSFVDGELEVHDERVSDLGQWEFYQGPAGQERLVHIKVPGVVAAEFAGDAGEERMMSVYIFGTSTTKHFPHGVPIQWTRRS